MQVNGWLTLADPREQREQARSTSSSRSSKQARLEHCTAV